MRHGRGGRDRVEGHVDERGDAAGRGGARACPEAFPVGASGLVQVYVGAVCAASGSEGIGVSVGVSVSVDELSDGMSGSVHPRHVKYEQH